MNANTFNIAKTVDSKKRAAQKKKLKSIEIHYVIASDTKNEKLMDFN